MRIAGRHWAMALSAAVLMHAGMATAVLWQPPDSGAKSVGMGGIEILLGPAGGAPGSVVSAALEVPEAEMVEPVETETTAPAETLAEAAPVETAEVAVEGETPAPQPVKEPAAVEVADAVPVAEEVEVATRQPPVEDTRAQQPAPAADTQPQEEAVARVVVAPPPPRLKPRPPESPRTEATRELVPELAQEPQQTAQAAEPAAEQTAEVAPSAPGAGGKAGAQTSPNAGSANDTSGGGVPGEMADYMAVLQAWLEKYKEYADDARRRNQQGTAVLRFNLGRQGQILDIELQKSSGYQLLDTAAIQMLHRAEPFPTIPENLGRTSVIVTAPIHFELE